MSNREKLKRRLEGSRGVSAIGGDEEMYEEECSEDCNDMDVNTYRGGG